MTDKTENIVAAFRRMTADEFAQHLIRVNAENVRWANLESKRRQLLHATTPILNEFMSTQVRERKILLAYVLGVAGVVNDELERLKDSEPINEPTHYEKLRKSSTDAEWITNNVHHIWPVSTGYDPVTSEPETQVERMLFIAHHGAECFNAVLEEGAAS